VTSDKEDLIKKKLFFLIFNLKTLHKKIFHVKVLDLNVICISYHVLIVWIAFLSNVDQNEIYQTAFSVNPVPDII
jgi:hypothetical protein